MKTIRIKTGSYGLSKPNSSGVITKTRTDPPFQIDDSEAERLVELGVAEYATGEEPTAEADGDSSGGSVETGKIVDTLNLSQLTRLNKDTQESIAKKLNVDLSAATNREKRGAALWDALEKKHCAVIEVKPDVYEIFEEAEIVEDEVMEDGETPPVLGADEPVD